MKFLLNTVSFCFFISIFKQNLMVEGSVKKDYLDITNKLSEILKGNFGILTEDTYNDVVYNLSEISKLTDQSCYDESVCTFITNLKNKMSTLEENDEDLKKVVKCFINCIRDTLYLLNYKKKFTYIDDQLDEFFKNLISQDLKYYGFYHELSVYQLFLKFEIKCYGMIIFDLEKKDVIIKMTQIFKNSEFQEDNFRFFVKSLKHECIALRNTLKKEFKESSDFPYENINYFISSVILNYLRKAKILEGAIVDRRANFMDLCDAYDIYLSSDEIKEKSSKLIKFREEIFKCKNLIKNETDSEKLKGLNKSLYQAKTAYESERKVYDVYQDSNDVGHFLFLFEYLNEKDYWIKDWEDLTEIIKDLIPFDNFISLSNFLSNLKAPTKIEN